MNVRTVLWQRDLDEDGHYEGAFGYALSNVLSASEWEWIVENGAYVGTLTGSVQEFEDEETGEHYTVHITDHGDDRFEHYNYSSYVVRRGGEDE